MTKVVPRSSMRTPPTWTTNVLAGVCLTRNCARPLVSATLMWSALVSVTSAWLSWSSSVTSLPSSSASTSCVGAVGATRGASLGVDRSSNGRRRAAMVSARRPADEQRSGCSGCDRAESDRSPPSARLFPSELKLQQPCLDLIRSPPMQSRLNLRNAAIETLACFPSVLELAQPRLGVVGIPAAQLRPNPRKIFVRIVHEPMPLRTLS